MTSNKIKKDHSKSALGSSQVEGQGTTNEETGTYKESSAKKKQTR